MVEDHKRKIQVEVAYSASSSEQFVVALYISDNFTILQAIEVSQVLYKYPEIDLNKNSVGIFSALKNLNDLPKNGDRIEIYRELFLSPNNARLERVKIYKKYLLDERALKKARKASSRPSKSD